MKGLKKYIKKHPEQWHFDFFNEGLNEHILAKENFLKKRDDMAKICGLTKPCLLTRDDEGNWLYNNISLPLYLGLSSEKVGEYYQLATKN